MKKTKSKAENKYTEAIGQNIRDARESVGMSRRILAKEMRTTGTTIRNWEFGYSQPRPYDLNKMCKILGVDIHNLLPTTA